MVLHAELCDFLADVFHFDAVGDVEQFDAALASLNIPDCSSGCAESIAATCDASHREPQFTPASTAADSTWSAGIVTGTSLAPATTSSEVQSYSMAETTRIAAETTFAVGDAVISTSNTISSDARTTSASDSSTPLDADITVPIINGVPDLGISSNVKQIGTGANGQATKRGKSSDSNMPVGSGTVAGVALGLVVAIVAVAALFVIKSRASSAAAEEIKPSNGLANANYDTTHGADMSGPLYETVDSRSEPLNVELYETSSGDGTGEFHDIIKGLGSRRLSGPLSQPGSRRNSAEYAEPIALDDYGDTTEVSIAATSVEVVPVGGLIQRPVSELGSDNGFVLDGAGSIRVASVRRKNPLFRGSVYDPSDTVGPATVTESTSM